jgi:predicted DCC family thiol-disulfide oxidoreductase YuxK
MISLASEYTDAKGRHARGWLFFDAECRFCTAFARSLRKILANRGLGVAPLQDPRVTALLGMTKRESLRELRFILSNNLQFGGADAVVALAREIWWAHPIAWLDKIPLLHRAMNTAYHAFARHRHCHAECHAPPAAF